MQPAKYFHERDTLYLSKKYPFSQVSFITFSLTLQVNKESDFKLFHSRVYDKWLWPSFDALLLFFLWQKWPIHEGEESCFFSVNVLLLTTEVEKIIIIMQKKLHQEKPICSSSHIQLHSGVHYYPFLGFLRAQNYLSLFLQHIGSSQGTVNTSTELCIEKLLICQTLK